jgi:BolA protein
MNMLSNIIKNRLQMAFSPTQLEVQDDSAQHQGHAGSQSGAGHYTIFIAADCFRGLSRVAIHREIYRVLNDLIPEQIHALQIKNF